MWEASNPLINGFIEKVLLLTKEDKFMQLNIDVFLHFISCIFVVERNIDVGETFM